ncbi:Flagellar protein FlgP [hydrothermal vent metagenome]|uniref:Flagellar protein FlgP n=1 Tax=hydrothermal vent metagenome TaxID=652676 RepID=A0A3B0WCX6_9ZZZZ
MKKQTVLKASLVGLASIFVLSGCIQSTSCCSGDDVKPNNQPAVAVQPTMPHDVAQVTESKPELLKISGIGYGAESTFGAYTPGQRRLMAIRASKLDAYRALAEQLYGVKIDSNTSISTLTAKSDSFRARVNAVVRGARIVSVTPMADRNYETVLEVYVDKRFFEQTFVYTASKTNVSSPESVYQVSSY